MAAAEPLADLRIAPAERRRFQRVKVNLLGRYMLADRREFPCQIINMSPGGMAVMAPVSGHLNERLIVYADHIGRLEGLITREFANGFAMTFAATPHKRDKLAAQLTWLANRDLPGMPDGRRHHRMMLRHPMTQMALPNGLNACGRIIDASLSGAAVASELRPPVGTPVTLGSVPGRVVRHLDVGFAVVFTQRQNPDSIEQVLSAR